jgi:hypothetical protein
MITKRNEKFIDAEWISRFFGTSHLDVRADRTQDWPMQKIWTLTDVQLQVYMMRRWPPGVLMKEEQPTLWTVYLELLNDEIRKENPGPWDSWDNPVKILKQDDPNVYYGDDAGK